VLFVNQTNDALGTGNLPCSSYRFSHLWCLIAKQQTERQIVFTW